MRTGSRASRCCGEDRDCTAPATPRGRQVWAGLPCRALPLSLKLEGLSPALTSPARLPGGGGALPALLLAGRPEVPALAELGGTRRSPRDGGG